MSAETKSPARVGISVSPRACLVDGYIIRVKHGCDAGKVLEHVESGKYIWVFDLCRRGGNIRDLRFLADEIADPKTVEGLDLEAVINRILPLSKPAFPSGEICVRFLISAPTLGRIRKEMNIRTGNISREPLASFLRQRWIGGGL